MPERQRDTQQAPGRGEGWSSVFHGKQAGGAAGGSRQCRSRFLEEKVKLGKVSQSPARPPDQGPVSASCLFWESEIRIK